MNTRYELVYREIAESDYILSPHVGRSDKGWIGPLVPIVDIQWEERHEAMAAAFYFGADERWHEFRGEIPLDATFPDQKQMEGLIDFAIQERRMYSESLGHRFYHVATIETLPLLFFACSGPSRDNRFMVKVPADYRKSTDE